MKPAVSGPRITEAIKPAPAPARAAAAPVEYSFLAGFLSYLIPGLGQIYQGRIAKGVLFFVSIYTLFFYGMYLGSWSNVYLPDTAKQSNPFDLPRFLANLYNRPQFAGQVWVGIAAWPALIQYHGFDEARDGHPLLGDYQRTPPENRISSNKPRGPTLNELQTDGDKTWDMGWVFTVIAGVLNVMVIYDAIAGPALRPVTTRGERKA